jgi:hypothetical protein
MDAVKAAAPETIAAPITKWPLFLYSEPFPGSVGNPLAMQAYVDALVKKASTITKEVADAQKLEEVERVRLDWVYALHNIEKKLLQKPFETFTVEDICSIASWLTRLTAQHPGVYRTHELKWPIRRISREEQERIDRIDALPEKDIGKEDAEFYQSCFVHFCSSQDIAAEMQEFVAGTAELIAYLRTKNFERSQHLAAVLNSAAFIHYTAVRIHAFEEGSKRLGRALMYIFLAQHGIEPITFYDSQLHGDKLIEVLTGNDKDAFKNYVCEMFVLSVKMRRNPLYLVILKELMSQQLSGPELMVAMLNHPLQKSHESKQSAEPASHAPVDRSALKTKPATSKSCLQCGKSSATAPSLKLLLCSRCKAVTYCSADCQKKHWLQHKIQCNKGGEHKK